MRLSPRMKNIILQCAFNSFGDVNVYLFGSRTDDTLRGGDIDIAVDTPELGVEEFRKKKAKFQAALLRRNFDIKVDIVLYQHKDALLFNEIKQTGVKLST